MNIKYFALSPSGMADKWQQAVMPSCFHPKRVAHLWDLCLLKQFAKMEENFFGFARFFKSSDNDKPNKVLQICFRLSSRLR